MSDLESSSGSRTIESPSLTIDAGKSTELGTPGRSDPEPTDPRLRRRDVSAEAAAVLRHLPLDPPGLPGSLGRLGHYEILKVVGRGAMGVVVRAQDTRLSRVVAIKLMSPNLTSSESASIRFEREARSAAGINHPNVVTIHEVSEHEGFPFLVMEYVDGITLQDRIRSDSPIEIAELLRIAVQVAEGLAAAHRQGVIHRDIKPSNIMLERGVGRVKITDFGLARVLQDQSELTSQGMVIGTPAYMSPEQVDGVPLDHRSDLFSLGCVIYAMASGHSPFRGENALGTARRIASMVPSPLHLVNKAVPLDLSTIVERLLAKEPEGRFPSADLVVEVLTSLLSRANRGVAPTDDRTVGPNDRGRSSGMILLVGVLILAVLTLLVALRSRSPEGRPSVPKIRQTASVDRVLTVAREPGAHFASLVDALRNVRPGQTIRVVDSGVYDEPLPVLRSRRYDRVRLESTDSAILRGPAGGPILTIEGVDGLLVAGFRFEAVVDQHAIEVRGNCPGLVLEDCQILASEESGIAAVYLHAGAGGTSDRPIRLSRCRVRGGGVGLVLGGLEDARPVSHVEVVGCRIRTPRRDQGIPIVLQVGVSDVLIRDNVIANGIVGISLYFLAPDRARGVLLEGNVLGDFQFPFEFNSSDHRQGIAILSNRVIDSDSARAWDGVEPYAGWFRGNTWEHGPDLDARLAGLFSAPPRPEPFASRDPGTEDYLEPERAGPSRSSRVPVRSRAN